MDCPMCGRFMYHLLMNREFKAKREQSRRAQLRQLQRALNTTRALLDRTLDLNQELRLRLRQKET